MPPLTSVETGPAGTTLLISPPSKVADMAADLKIRGCPVCQHITKHAADFFGHWQYQIATEDRAQADFASEWGFCPLHTWQLRAVTSPRGTSVGYARLADQIARRLRERRPTLNGDMVGRLVRDSRNCRVCELLRQAETEYIRRVAALIDEAAGRSRYYRSQGVCLKHLGMLVDAVKTVENRKFLIAHAAQRFEEDAEDMRSYALKREALRRDLGNRNEEDAYRRAIIRFVGARNVCAPWAEDGEI